MMGRRLYPLLDQAGYRDIEVSPRLVYADSSRPALVEGFVRDTFTAMVAGVAERAVAAGLTDAARFEAGIDALHRTAGSIGTFHYTFFKASAQAPNTRSPMPDHSIGTREATENGWC